MRKHGFKQFLLPVGLFCAVFSLVSCGGQSQEEAAPPADQSEETSQVMEFEDESVETAEELSAAKPKELTDAELLSVLANHEMVKDRFPTLRKVDSFGGQFSSFYGDPDEATDNDLYNVARNISPEECAEAVWLSALVSENVEPSVRTYNHLMYLPGQGDQIALQAVRSKDKDYIFWYGIKSYYFKGDVVDNLFQNIVSAWANCEKVTYVEAGNKPGSVQWLKKLTDKDTGTDYFLTENALVIITTSDDGVSSLRSYQFVGNVVETDAILHPALPIKKYIKFLNDRAKALAKAQGIEIEDIDIDNLDKYRVTNDTVFPEYKKIESGNVL